MEILYAGRLDLIQHFSDIIHSLKLSDIPFIVAPYGSVEALQWLKEYCNIEAKDFGLSGVLERAIEYGNEKVVTYLIDQQVPFDTEKNIAKYFISRQIPVHIQNNIIKIPLDYAIINFTTQPTVNSHKIIDKIINRLLENSADIALIKKSISLAIRSQGPFTPYIVATLLKRFVQQGQKDDTLLHKAVILQHTEAGKFLIEKGADIHLKNKDGRTPLDLAVHSGNLELIKELTKKNLLLLAIRYRNLGLIFQIIRQWLFKPGVIINSLFTKGCAYFPVNEQSIFYQPDSSPNLAQSSSPRAN